MDRLPPFADTTSSIIDNIAHGKFQTDAIESFVNWGGQGGAIPIAIPSEVWMLVEHMVTEMAAKPQPHAADGEVTVGVRPATSPEGGLRLGGAMRPQQSARTLAAHQQQAATSNTDTNPTATATAPATAQPAPTSNTNTRTEQEKKEKAAAVEEQKKKKKRTQQKKKDEAAVKAAAVEAAAVEAAAAEEVEVDDDVDVEVDETASEAAAVEAAAAEEGEVDESEIVTETATEPAATETPGVETPWDLQQVRKLHADLSSRKWRQVFDHAGLVTLLQERGAKISTSRAQANKVAEDRNSLLGLLERDIAAADKDAVVQADTVAAPTGPPVPVAAPAGTPVDEDVLRSVSLELMCLLHLDKNKRSQFDFSTKSVFQQCKSKGLIVPEVSRKKRSKQARVLSYLLARQLVGPGCVLGICGR